MNKSSRTSECLTTGITISLITVTKKRRRSALSLSRKLFCAGLALPVIFVFCAETKTQTPISSPQSNPVVAAASRETAAQPRLALEEQNAHTVFGRTSASDATAVNQPRSGPSSSSLLKRFLMFPLRILKAIGGSFGEGSKSDTNSRGGVDEVIVTAEAKLPGDTAGAQVLSDTAAENESGLKSALFPQGVTAGKKLEFEFSDLSTRGRERAVSVFINSQPTPTDRREVASARRFDETKELLASLDDVLSDRDILAKLFRSGDERTEDLIRALDDPDSQISLRSQIIIRYLGSEVGMKAVFESYTRHGYVTLGGPIPVPLNAWDYSHIQSSYLSTPPKWDSLIERYIYAMALDGSEKAKEVNHEMIRQIGNLDERSTVGRAIKFVQERQPTAVLTGSKDLGELVLENAFFVAPSDMKYTSTHLLAMNPARDKALVEIYINRGALSEEWYHVVITKVGDGWKFFSITQVAVS